MKRTQSFLAWGDVSGLEAIDDLAWIDNTETDQFLAYVPFVRQKKHYYRGKLSRVRVTITIETVRKVKK